MTFKKMGKEDKLFLCNYSKDWVFGHSPPPTHTHININSCDGKSSKNPKPAFEWQAKEPGSEHSMCAPCKIFHSGKLRQANQLTLPDKREKKIFFKSISLYIYHCEN